MAKNQPMTIKIEPQSDGVRRFRWSIFAGDRLRDNSPVSYATMREAKADAERAMQRLAVRQRTLH
jgi:hypothetical protein